MTIVHSATRQWAIIAKCPETPIKNIPNKLIYKEKSP